MSPGKRKYYNQYIHETEFVYENKIHKNAGIR